MDIGEKVSFQSLNLRPEVGSRIINGKAATVFWFSVFPGHSCLISAGSLPRSELEIQGSDLAFQAL